jgi:hypothetical protein
MPSFTMDGMIGRSLGGWSRPQIQIHNLGLKVRARRMRAQLRARNVSTPAAGGEERGKGKDLVNKTPLDGIFSEEQIVERSGRSRRAVTSIPGYLCKKSRFSLRRSLSLLQSGIKKSGQFHLIFLRFSSLNTQVLGQRPGSADDPGRARTDPAQSTDQSASAINMVRGRNIPVLGT